MILKRKIQIFKTYTSVYYWNRDSNARFVINQGGTSSSKTYSILQVLIIKALKKKVTITVVAETFNALQRGALRDFKNLVDSSYTVRKFLLDYSLVRGPYIFTNGSIIEFVSLDKPGKAKHGKRDFLFVNEANHIEYNTIKQLMIRTSKQIFIDFNADAIFWAHTEIAVKDDAVLYISNYTHNPYIAENTVLDLLSYKRKWLSSIVKDSNGNIIEENLHYKNTWLVYGLGKTGITVGVIFQQVNWIKELPTILNYRAYVIDWGFSIDPTAIIKVGVFNGEIYAEGLLYEIGLTTPDVELFLRRLGVKRYDLIIADNANPDAIRQLQRKGFNIIPAYKYQGSIVAGIQSLLGIPLNIVYNKDWIIEQQNYKWLNDGTKLLKRPIDKYNHYWDTLRYWYQYFWGGKILRNRPSNKRKIKIIKQ